MFHYANNKISTDAETINDWISMCEDGSLPCTDEYYYGDWYCDTVTEIAKEAARQIHEEERGECKVIHDTYGDWHCYENGEKEYVSIGD